MSAGARIPVIMHGETAPREPSFIARLLAAADASLRADPIEPVDFSVPSFPWLPRTLPAAATVQRSETGVTAQEGVFCA